MSQPLAEQSSSKWVYTTITLYDAERILSPSQVSFDRVIFPTPPNLTSKQVEIVIRNGNDELRTIVNVLPHDSNATEIPINIIATQQKAPAKLTA